MFVYCLLGYSRCLVFCLRTTMISPDRRRNEMCPTRRRGENRYPRGIGGHKACRDCCGVFTGVRELANIYKGLSGPLLSFNVVIVQYVHTHKRKLYGLNRKRLFFFFLFSRFTLIPLPSLDHLFLDPFRNTFFLIRCPRHMRTEIIAFIYTHTYIQCNIILNTSSERPRESYPTKGGVTGKTC